MPDDARKCITLEGFRPLDLAGGSAHSRGFGGDCCRNLMNMDHLDRCSSSIVNGAGDRSRTDDIQLGNRGWLKFSGTKSRRVHAGNSRLGAGAATLGRVTTRNKSRPQWPPARLYQRSAAVQYSSDAAARESVPSAVVASSQRVKSALVAIPEETAGRARYITVSTAPSVGQMKPIDERTIPKATLTARLFAEGVGDIPAMWKEATGLPISVRTGLRAGIHGKRGTRLETVKCNGRRLTSAPAVLRYIEATQFNEPLPVEQAIDVAAADQVLAAHGLGRGEV